MKHIRRYALPEQIPSAISNLHPLLQRIYLARGISSQNELDYSLNQLLPYHKLSDVDKAVNYLYEALLKQQRIVIVGDFDVDGATSVALAVLALRQFGYQEVSYVIPNRFEFGYGLTPEIVAVVHQQHKAELLITVDNGIASIEGVSAAKQLGIKVIITDHHLPTEILPEAEAILDPNKAGDEFPSKNLAGVGVIFYLMLALRSKLRELDWFKQQNISEPNMTQFLDLVALGTVADLVPLDRNNRILVHHGLERIKAGSCRLGIRTLLAMAKRDYERVTTDDLVYAIAPRLNAAGRLDDMSVGVSCLLSDALQHSRALARELTALNDERRTIEAGMHQQAMQVLTKMDFAQNLPAGLCIFDETWHQGVVGILASKIKDRFQRPAIVFAAVGEDEIKGSARSIAGLHMRDLLDKIAVQNPGLIIKFGGHAMAAGVSLRRADYERFSSKFVAEVDSHLARAENQSYIYSDGELSAVYFSLEIAEMLQKAGPWGHGFSAPLFDGVFDLVQQRLVGEKHLKMTISLPENKQEIDAICFNVDLDAWPNYRCQKVHLVYRLDINEYNGRRSLQLMVDKLAAYLAP